MKIQPLGDRVLIKPVEAEEKTSGGLYIPQNAQEKTQMGTVVAVGDDEEISVKKGQKVFYDKYAGTTVTIDSVDHLIVRNDDLIAVAG